jgi:crotonobetaine/carnitine-CoA ligase
MELLTLESRRIPRGDGRPDLPWITLGELLRRLAAQDPERLAVAFVDGEQYTFARLDAACDTAVMRLRALGILAGERVATMLDNSIDQIVVFFACARMGAVSVPLNVALRAPEIARIVADTQPRVLITNAELNGVVDAAVSLRAEEQPRVLVAHELDWLGDAAELESTQAEWDLPQISPADPSCILFTGGTTGLPKGIVRTHFSYICAGSRYAEIVSPRETDRHFGVAQLYHCGGQECDLLGPMMAGVPTLLARRFSASRYWDVMRDFQATISTAFGATIGSLIAREPTPRDSTNELRICIGAMQGLGPTVKAEFQRRFGVEHLLEVYAMSETGTMLFYNSVSDGREDASGRSHGWCDVIIADELDMPLDDGEVGQILIRPRIPFSMSLGYFRQPEATAAHWRNLWIHTGDLGRLDGAWLYFQGRQAHWVRRRGENVSCIEVEEVLNRYPGVAESVVVGVPSRLGDEELVAVVVPLPGSNLVPAQLLEFTGTEIAYFKVPRFVGLRDKPLPRSSAKGEIERHNLGELPELLWDQRLSDFTSNPDA